MESLKKVSRKEKVKYINTVPGYAAAVTMKNQELDEILDLIERGEEQAKEAKVRKKRGGRIPLGQHRSKMSVESLNLPDSVVPRWINDIGGRIRDALDGAYKFVDDPNLAGRQAGEDPLQPQGMGSALNIPVGTHEDGSPMIAYLMTIDKELYEEDQADKQRVVDEIDKAILEGHHQSSYADGKYRPDGGTKMQR
jgi:hypothetical protein